MSEIDVLIVEPDAMRLVTLEQGGDAAWLKTLQGVLGGYLEAIPGDGWHAYLNEEGTLLDLPPNPLATRLLTELLDRENRIIMLPPGGQVQGPVVFLATRGEHSGSTPQHVLDAAAQLGPVSAVGRPVL